jgi:hypothetical protein
MGEGADVGQLREEIGDAIREVADLKEIARVKSLSRHNPERVAEILWHYSTGKSLRWIRDNVKVDPVVCRNVLRDYADHLGKFRELGGKMAADRVLELHDIQMEMLERYRGTMEEKGVSAKDIKEVSVAMSLATKEAMVARGEATSHVKVEKAKSIEEFREDFEEWIKENTVEVEEVD